MSNRIGDLTGRDTKKLTSKYKSETSQLQEPARNRQLDNSTPRDHTSNIRGVNRKKVLSEVKYCHVAGTLFMGNKGIQWVMNTAVKISVWCDF
jgi:hypothetical protein